MKETSVQSLAGEDPLEKEMATHSCILDWRIPWTEEPVGLQSMGLQRVGQTECLSTAQTYDLTILEAGKSRTKALQGWVLQASVRETLWRPCPCLSPFGGCWPSLLFLIGASPRYLHFCLYGLCAYLCIQRSPFSSGHQLYCIRTHSKGFTLPL